MRVALGATRGQVVRLFVRGGLCMALTSPVLSSWIPARRSANVDPVQALRAESLSRADPSSGSASIG